MTQFVDGIKVFKPRDNAPQFVKGALLINKAQLVNWLTSQGDNIKVQILESKKGSWYLAVDNFEKPATGARVGATVDDNPDDLPF